MAVSIITEKCRGCSLCEKACPFGAIQVVNRTAQIGDTCTGCGSCVSVCPFGAIAQDEVSAKGIDLSAYHDVWVFAEQRDGQLQGVVAELLGKGRQLADAIGSRLCAILPGYQIEGLTKELFGYGADVVYLADNPLLETFTTDAYAKVLSDAIVQYKPEIVLYGATYLGRDLAPRIAARINTGLTADCTGLEIAEDGNLLQTRPAFGGNLMATIRCPEHRPQMATVRRGVMEKASFDPNRSGEVIDLGNCVSEDDIHTKVLDVVKSVKSDIPLTDADIIVAGGAGLGSAEGFDLIRKFANQIGAAVGASRAAVDNGWIDKDRQVGQTGTTVKPKIYIACGISGAIQHLAGMQTSDTIIAINKNAAAPIFSVADYGLVGDLYQIVPLLMEEWAKA